MTRRRLPFVGAFTALLVTASLLTGCQAADSSRPVVAVTTNILADAVRQIAGDQVEVLDLMPAGADPHSFQISAQEAARMRDADLVVSNGLGLEEGLAQHIEAASDDGVAVVAAGDAVQTVEWTSEDATGVDPHFWTDPRQMAAALKSVSAAIAEHVSNIDTEALARDTEAYLNEIAALDAELETGFAAIPESRRALVTNHHVFGYLAERYGFTVIGAVIPSGTTLAAPSANDLDSLAGAIRSTGVTTIFVDSSQPSRLAEVLASEAGLGVAVTPLHTESLSGPGGGAETYLEMMRSNARDIRDGLS
jgi:zinc/manganese transport system substrate-binding protein